MARSLRIQYPGAYYHVMARGNRREAIFHDDDDRRFFLHTLAQACEMTGWRVQAWVLMGNHYHLFLQTPEPNLVAGMGWLQNTYTRRYNVRHRAWGRVFGDRYKAVLVEGTDRYQSDVDGLHSSQSGAGADHPPWARPERAEPRLEQHRGRLCASAAEAGTVAGGAGGAARL